MKSKFTMLIWAVALVISLLMGGGNVIAMEKNINNNVNFITNNNKSEICFNNGNNCFLKTEDELRKNDDC